MSLKTELQAAIAYCNTALNAKGAASASTVYDIGDKIDTIQTGGGGKELIASYTPSEEARSWWIEFPSGFDITEYKAVIIEGTVEMSGGRWLYVSNTADRATGNYFYNEGNTVDLTSPTLPAKVTPTVLFYNGTNIVYGASRDNGIYGLALNGNGWYYVTYNNNGTILTTSEIKIYGLK